MTISSYHAVPYRSEYKPDVAKLLTGLWSDDPVKNSSYFEWKYEDNPYAESPLGILILHHGEVVGFRGYFALRFEVPGRNDNVPILIPGDTCVRLDHRRKGLSVTMGDLAKQEYAERHRLFLNMTCSRESLPGYRRMGFLPLAERVFLTRASLLGSVRYILADRATLRPPRGVVDSGRTGELEVSTRPRAAEMAVLVSEQSSRRDKIGLLQDERFFRWRFRNPQRNYAFYYSFAGDLLTGYVVIGLSRNNRRGFILDYAQISDDALRTILRQVIRAKRFDILSIYDFCLEQPLADTLKQLGFSRHGLVRAAERRLSGELPILIRPIRETYVEADLFIEGLDTRDINNWCLKPICSDGA
jgi:hypothetical protein